MRREQNEDWDQDDFLAENDFAPVEHPRPLEFDYVASREYEPELEESLGSLLDEMPSEDDPPEDEENPRVESVDDPEIEALVNKFLAEALVGG